MKKRIIIATLIAVLLTIGGIILYLDPFKEETKPEIVEVKAIDNIGKFGYVLYENKTEVYKEYFNTLKDTLNQEVIDEKKYAELLAELFVIDFYTLNNKTSNTDIGGIEFIHKEAKDTFILSAKDTIYKYVESNVYGDRKQKLPEVATVTLKNITNEKFTGEKVSDDNCYKVEMTLTYKEDMGYPTTVTTTLVHGGEKLYIVEVK